MGLINNLREKTKFTDIEIHQLINDIMIGKKMIDFKEFSENGDEIYVKSPEYSEILKEQNLPEEQRKALEDLFASDTRNFVEEWNRIKPKKNIVIRAQHLEEFKTLWNTINKDMLYTFENLDSNSEARLIDNIKTEIEALNIEDSPLQTTRRELDINKIGEADSIIKIVLEGSVSYKSKVDYLRIVSDLSIGTGTPVLFVAKIFNALSMDFKSEILANNPVQAFKEMTVAIRKNLVDMIKNKIQYCENDGAILPNIFLNENSESLYGNNETYLKAGSVGKYQMALDNGLSPKEKWVFKDIIEYDSGFEVDIVKQDMRAPEIEFFGKLPKLKIKTPFDTYSPDFCYAVKSTAGNKLILIVESKGYDTTMNIPHDEKVKIELGQKYFERLNDYYKSRNVNVKILFKERIKGTQLSSLIKKILEGDV